MTDRMGITHMRLSNLGYLIKEGIKGIFKHGFMSFASVTIIMACLIIMGVFSLLGLNINNVISDLEAQNELVAFIDDSLSTDEARELETILLKVPTVSFVEFVSREGFDPIYGARPLKRAIQSKIEDTLAEIMLDNGISDGSNITVDCEDGKIVVK